ncbi:MAG: helix-turn-helix transcriptional regulator [Oscillospiraceae bacterium]|nr:helix-turn-helix transcriptional regulator [Oscillospiraceae bacterium]
MGIIRDEIAKNILYYRKKIGMSQKDFASKMGVSPPSVSNWESGTNSIDIENLFKACQILGVSIDDIYGKCRISEEYQGEQKKPTANGDKPYDDELSQIISIYKELSVENRAKFLELSRLYSDALRSNDKK